MQSLIDAVQQVKQTIQIHKSELVNNEALTRYALIDVILNALGWNVHDPSKVFPEYNKGVGGSADYALLGNLGKPVALIEAKKLHSINPNVLLQVTNYAFNSGIKYSIATDGKTWIVADAFLQVPFSQKEIMRFDIETEPDNFLLVKLVTLSPTNLCDPNKAFFPEIQPVNANNSFPLSKNGKTQSGKTTSKNISNLPINNTNWSPFTQILNSSAKPTQIKFPDGTIKRVSSSNDILKQVAEWLIQTQKIKQVPILDSAGKKRYVINTQPLHTDGNPFLGKYLLSNGWYLETNYSSDNSKKNALELLNKLGENPSDYYFQ